MTVLLKLSSGTLMGRREFGLDKMVGAIATDIKAVVAMGVQVSVVIGGGNIYSWRLRGGVRHGPRSG